MNNQDQENSFKKFILEYENSQRRAQKFKFIVASLTILLSLIFYFLFFMKFNEVQLPFITSGLLLPVIITLTIISALILRYLQPNSEKKQNDKFNYSIDKLKNIEKNFDLLLQKKNNLEITEDDKKTILTNIQKNIESESFKNYVDSIYDLVKSQNKTEDIDSYFQRSFLRLNREVQDLTKRGNINLVLGIVTTIFGLILLAITAFTIPQIHDIQNFAFFFTPRLSLVVMIEIFSYFFLKLYRQNLYEIKYFQNEITNIELKFFSTYLSLQTADCQQINTIACKLADTDRNATVNKDKASVDTGRNMTNQNNESKLIQLLSGFTSK